MSEPLPDEFQSLFKQPFEHEPRIVVTPLPSYRELEAFPWRLIVMMSLVAGYVYLASRWSGGVGLAASNVMILLLVFVVVRSLWRMANSPKRRGETPWERAVVSAMLEADRFRRRSRIERRWRELLRDDPPSAIIDDGIAPDLAALPRSEALLEPEAIRQSRKYMLLSTLGLLVLGLFFLNQLWWAGLPFFVMAFLCAVQAPALRNRVPTLRLEGDDLLAGPGWLRDCKRAWTVADSTAVFFHSPGEHVPLRVRFIGPQGVRDLSFAGIDNHDFQLLWQRWMHPHPRPELCGADLNIEMKASSAPTR